MNRTRRGRILAIAFVAMSLVLASCTPGDDTAGDVTTTEGQQPGGTETTAVEDPGTETTASPDTTPASGEPVTVEFWHLQVGPNGEALEARINEFNSMQDAVLIEPVFQGDSTTLHQSVLAAIATGDLPVMAEAFAPSFVGEYVDAGVVTPMEELFDGSEDLDDIFPGFLAESILNVEGQEVLVSWPFAKSVLVMYYNIAKLQEAEIDVPASWSEFQEVAAQLTDFNGAPAFSWNPSFGQREFYASVWGNGGDVYDVGTNEVLFGDSAGAEALATFADMQAAGDLQVVEGFDFQQEFAAERSLLAVSSSASNPFLLDAVAGGFEVGFAPFPAGSEEQVTAASGTTVVVFNSASDQEKQAAWSFLTWFSSTENSLTWAESTQFAFQPIRESSLSGAAYETAISEYPGLGDALVGMTNARARPTVGDWSQVDAIVSEMLLAATTNAASVEEALADAVAASNAALAE